MGNVRPDPRNLLPRVSRYLNVRLSSFASHLNTIMSSLPNLREYDDFDLAESPSDSEELFAAKFAERSRRRQEARECEERERREREEREAREARERQSQEERERTACEEVRRGKVGARGSRDSAAASMG